MVLSHGFWQRRYGSDPGVIGQPITLDGETLTIVGVMPEGFAVRTPSCPNRAPSSGCRCALVPGDPTGMGGILNVVGPPGRQRHARQAQAELTAIARRIEAAHPSYSRDWGVHVVSLLEATVKDVRLALLVLLGAVGNPAAHRLRQRGEPGAEPRRDTSDGAGASGSRSARTRGRLVRQFLTESLVLAAVGGVLGDAAGDVGNEVLVSALPAGLDLPRTAKFGVDLRVLGLRLPRDDPHRHRLRAGPFGSARPDRRCARPTRGSSCRPQPEPPRKHHHRLGGGARGDVPRGCRSSRSQLLGAEPGGSRIPDGAGPHNAHHAPRLSV